MKQLKLFGTHFIFLLLVLTAMVPCKSFAQPGALDLSFNNSDPGFNNPSGGANNTVYAIAHQNDGKIIIAGSFTSYNGQAINYITRVNANGTKDISFNTGGVGPNATVKTLALQSDGKIVIAGIFSSYNNVPVPVIIRLNSNGTRDASFNTGTWPAIVNTVVIQPDGKILVGNTGGGNANILIRLNTDGTRDLSFVTNLSYSLPAGPAAMSVALQPDGKIVVGGRFGPISGLFIANIIRLNTNGARDTTFNNVLFGGSGVGTNNYVSAVAVQPNGKILIGGGFTSYSSLAATTSANHIARLNTDGTIDPLFNVSGSGADQYINAFALQQDGSILIGGFFTSYNGSVVNRLARLHADGSLDNSFATTGTNGANAEINAITFQPDSAKFLIGGSFTSYNTTGRNRIARIYGIDCSVSVSAISGPSRSCLYTVASGISATYSVTAPATSAFLWSVSNPATMHILSGQNTNSIQLQYANDFSSGLVYVRVSNTNCGFAVNPFIAVNSNPPAAPGAIVPDASIVCPFLGTAGVVTYTIRKVSGATSYNWAAQAGTTIITHTNGTGVNDTTVTVNFASGFTTSPISVQAINDCGASSTRSLNISLQAGPTGEIIVQSAGACPDRTYIYTLDPQTLPVNANSVIWTVPAGATIVSGQGTVTLTVSYPPTAVSGFVTARGANGCTVSNARKIAVSLPACAPFARNGKLPANAKNSIAEMHFDVLDVKISPNPSVSRFQLYVTTSSPEKVAVKIFEMQGRLVKEILANPEQSIEFGSDLRPGTYLVEVTQGKNVKTTRVLKF